MLPFAAHAQAPRSTSPSISRALPPTRPSPSTRPCCAARCRTGSLSTCVATRKPEKRAELWLAVNAGSVLEDDDQRGLAHFVEHMAFNGTKRFPKASIVDFLERIGMRFGADLNAYTSFDETVYMLAGPDRQPARHRRHGARHPARLGRRRLVRHRPRSRRSAASSSRSGGSAAARRCALFDKQFPVLFQGSQYADAPPDRHARDPRERRATRSCARSTRTGTAPT